MTHESHRMKTFLSTEVKWIFLYAVQSKGQENRILNSIVGRGALHPTSFSDHMTLDKQPTLAMESASLFDAILPALWWTMCYTSGTSKHRQMELQD